MTAWPAPSQPDPEPTPARQMPPPIDGPDLPPTSRAAVAAPPPPPAPDAETAARLRGKATGEYLGLVSEQVRQRPAVALAAAAGVGALLGWLVKR